jgi:hypothetical protein
LLPPTAPSLNPKALDVIADGSTITTLNVISITTANNRSFQMANSIITSLHSGGGNHDNKVALQLREHLDLTQAELTAKSTELTAKSTKIAELNTKNAELVHCLKNMDELATNMKQEMSWIKVSFSAVQQNGQAEQQKRQVAE